MSLGAVPVIIAAVILRAVLKNAPKSMSIMLWVLAAFKLVCPFSIASRFSLLQPESGTAQGVTAEGNGAILVRISETAEGNVTLSESLAYIWLAGLAVLLVYAVFSYLRLRKKTAVSVRTKDNIYICDHIDSAFILGIIRPKIFIPSATGSVHMKYIIAHEQMHLKWLDQIWKALGYVILMLHWFNPLVWVAYSLFCRDLELCCDERVIKDMELSEKKEYSRALLISSLPHRGIPGCPLAFAELGVKERIKAVLNYRKPGFWIILVSVLACVIAAVLFVTEPKQDEAVIGTELQSEEDITLSSRLPDDEELSSKDAENEAPSLPGPGEGGKSQLIEKGENSIKVSFLEGEVTYTVLSARLEENMEDMEHCLLVRFSVHNENVSEEFSRQGKGYANCFNISDGQPWSEPDRYFAEPEYLDIAKSKPSKYNKDYFQYDFPADGEDKEFTLGYGLDEAGIRMLEAGELYLSYTLDEINIPLKIKDDDRPIENIENEKLGILYLPTEGVGVKALKADIDLWLNAETETEKQDVLEDLLSNPNNRIINIEKKEAPSKGGKAEAKQ
ncbi:MAG: M56 family metallopeptidase [Candidatus Limivicinus sp.]